MLVFGWFLYALVLYLRQLAYCAVVLVVGVVVTKWLHDDCTYLLL